MDNANEEAVVLSLDGRDLQSDCVRLRAELAAALHESARLQTLLDACQKRCDHLLAELRASRDVEEQQQDDLHATHEKLKQLRQHHLTLSAQLQQHRQADVTPETHQQQQDHITQQDRRIEELQMQVLHLHDMEETCQSMSDAKDVAEEELSRVRMNAAIQRAETSFAISQREHMDSSLSQVQQELQQSKAAFNTVSNELRSFKEQHAIAARHVPLTVTVEAGSAPSSLSVDEPVAGTCSLDAESVSRLPPDINKGKQYEIQRKDPGPKTSEGQQVAASSFFGPVSKAHHSSSDRKQVVGLKAQLAALLAATQAHVAEQEAATSRDRAAFDDLQIRCVIAEAAQLAARQECQAASAAAAAADDLKRENAALLEQLRLLGQRGYHGPSNIDNRCVLSGHLTGGLQQHGSQPLGCGGDENHLQIHLANEQGHTGGTPGGQCPAGRKAITDLHVQHGLDRSAVPDFRSIDAGFIAVNVQRPQGTVSELPSSNRQDVGAYTVEQQQHLHDPPPQYHTILDSANSKSSDPQDPRVKPTKRSGLWAYVTGAA